MPGTSYGEDVARVATRVSTPRCPPTATSRPTAHAEMKHITSPYENSFCQFQRIGSIMLVMDIREVLAATPVWSEPMDRELLMLYEGDGAAQELLVLSRSAARRGENDRQSPNYIESPNLRQGRFAG